MLKAGAPQHLQRAALLRAGLVDENDPHTRGRQQCTRTHADHHRTASTDTATVMISAHNARTPRRVTQIGSDSDWMRQDNGAGLSSRTWQEPNTLAPSLAPSHAVR